MKNIFKVIPLLILFSFIASGFMPTDTKPVKCMIQMTNYTGEGAYVVISLINPKGEYEQTLYVQGKDPEWYSEITEWWKFYGKRKSNIDAIAGETIKGGARTVSILQIPADKIDKGYSLRFETAVEDKEYHKTDLQFPLTSQNLASKMDGTGYIRYVRMLAK